jgi:hypothetical protein
VLDNQYVLVEALIAGSRFLARRAGHSALAKGGDGSGRNDEAGS